jgi:hypothetical protein
MIEQFTDKTGKKYWKIDNGPVSDGQFTYDMVFTDKGRVFNKIEHTPEAVVETVAEVAVPVVEETIVEDKKSKKAKVEETVATVVETPVVVEETQAVVEEAKVEEPVTEA